MKKLLSILLLLTLAAVAFGADIGTLAIHHGFDCETVNGKVVKWRDARPQPTQAEWEALAAAYEAEKSSGAAKARRAVSTDEMVEAMWRKFMENDSTMADAIQAKRNAAKAK